MRGVGKQRLLRAHNGFDAFRRTIEAARDLGDLVATLDCDTLGQRAGAPDGHAPLQALQASRKAANDGEAASRYRNRHQADEDRRPVRRMDLRRFVQEQPATVVQRQRIVGFRWQPRLAQRWHGRPPRRLADSREQAFVRGVQRDVDVRRRLPARQRGLLFAVGRGRRRQGSCEERRE